MSRHYHTRVSEIWKDGEDIIHVVFKEGIEINLLDMEEGYAIFRELGIGPGQGKGRQLLSGGHFTLSKEAREFAGRTGENYFVAAAMVTDSVLMRLIINTFNTIVKHNVPFKIFSSEAEAVEWLRKFE